MSMKLNTAWVIAALTAVSSSASAGITRYGNGERDDWFNDVGGASQVTTIGFSDFGDDVFITDQYQHLGVTFTDGNDLTSGFAPSTWPQDGWGLDGNGDIDLTFDAPRTFIAVDHPGSMRFELYMDGQIVGDEIFATNGRGNFGGIVSTVPFNEVTLSSIVDADVNIDDLHFTHIPGPSGLVILSGLLFVRSRNRRRGRTVFGCHSSHHVQGELDEPCDDFTPDRRRPVRVEHHSVSRGAGALPPA